MQAPGDIRVRGRMRLGECLRGVHARYVRDDRRTRTEAVEPVPVGWVDRGARGVLRCRLRADVQPATCRGRRVAVGEEVIRPRQQAQRGIQLVALVAGGRPGRRAPVPRAGRLRCHGRRKNEHDTRGPKPASHLVHVYLLRYAAIAQYEGSGALAHRGFPTEVDQPRPREIPKRLRSKTALLKAEAAALWFAHPSDAELRPRRESSARKPARKFSSIRPTRSASRSGAISNREDRSLSVLS